MGKLGRSSYKTKSDPSYDKPLQMLHVDLYGPISMQCLRGKKYILVLIDDFSQFVRKKSQVPMILINHLKRFSARGTIRRSIIGGSFLKQSSLNASA
ncbi:hypothetical protein OSB04_024788 [Centaurea solstitialis]|uniref:Integrase catalytic domain-containing protein n=1 Tax=Centaurea solstitialis TaxID=347529 RepID=A0AA38SYH3_9ASTR|nr:hypothetical protein OSB04_024788 [Centaurea solstitialis]